MPAEARSPAELILEVIRLKDEANEIARALLGRDYSLIGDLSLPTPPLEPPELGFIRAVAWLYGQYQEAGAVGVRFVSSLFEGWEVDPDKGLREHIAVTGRLRTFLQHNLDFARHHDRDTLELCEDWFETACGTRRPGDDAHWTACLSQLMGEAAALFRGLVAALRAIESDSGREQILAAWRFRIERHHPASDFDSLIEAVAIDMGREHIDVVRFRRRFHDRWTEALNVLDGEYDFEVEARRLIEYSLLTELASALPVTGADIMHAFEIEPGPEVGEILERALAIFTQSPCSREDLLERLRAEQR